MTCMIKSINQQIVESKATMSKKSIVILYNKSSKDSMPKLKKEKNRENIKPKEEISSMMKPNFINSVPVQGLISHKWNGHKNKN